MPSPYDTPACAWCRIIAGPKISPSPARRFSAAHSGGGVRDRRRAALLLVPLARHGDHAAACQPEPDPESGAWAAYYSVVQMPKSGRSAHGFRHLLLPIVLTTARGLREVEPDLLDLVRTLQGLALADLHQEIQFPGALPYIFSGMKVPPSLRSRAQLWEFLGSDRGLGYLMLQVQVTLDTGGDVHGGYSDYADRGHPLRPGAGSRRAGCSRRAAFVMTHPHRFSVSPLRKAYRARGDAFAISEVSFDVAAGELVALVGGPSAVSAKPTLLEESLAVRPDFRRVAAGLAGAAVGDFLARHRHGVPAAAIVGNGAASSTTFCCRRRFSDCPCPRAAPVPAICWRLLGAAAAGDHPLWFLPRRAAARRDRARARHDPCS